MHPILPVPSPVGDDCRMRTVPTRDGRIRLGQFLKLADAVEAGSDVKVLLAQGAVLVNGEPEDRRGRQLLRDDVVTVREEQFMVQ
jgi:ribosome-associated protein